MILLFYCCLLPVVHAFSQTNRGFDDVIANNVHDAISNIRLPPRSLRSAPLDDVTDHRAAGGKQLKTRRNAIQRMVSFVACAPLFVPATGANAVMTDETASFASEFADPTYRLQSPPASLSSASATRTPGVPPLSDEVTFKIGKSDLLKMRGGLGLELGEVSFRTNFRVVVRSVAPNSLAESLGVRPGWVVASVNGADGERTNASGVVIYFKRAVEAALAAEDGSAGAVLTLTFRDPSKFRSELGSFPAADDGAVVGGTATVSTKVAPAGDITQRYVDGSPRPGASVSGQSDQVVTVSQLIPPRLCRRRATTDDLLEISYVGQVVETGAIFDGSAVKINGEAIPGRGNDISVFFVLGKQPFGQFPPGWDVGLEGMCVGERRRLVIPPVLAYGSEGIPRRGIPPNASLQYDVTLVSLNGLATPQ
jgi:FK506-binding protein 2